MIGLEQQLCKVAAVLVAGDDERIRDVLKNALDDGIRQSILREVILTAYLFDGYPTALEGFRILAEISTPAENNQSEFKNHQQNITLWRARGEKLCRTIYGPQYEPLMRRVAVIAPELADAMLVEGYGKVLAREQLEPRIRELCIVAILAVKNKPRQLLSHALGALRLGADAVQLRNAVKTAEEFSPAETLMKTQRIIDNAIKKLP